MKRILYTAAVICLSLLAAQCTKDIDELQEVEGQKIEIGESYMEMTPGGQVYMYLGISGGSDGATRTTIADASSSGIRAVSWNEGDKIYVVAPTEGCLGSLTAKNSGTVAAFEGTISSWTGTQTLHYYYVGSANSIADKATSYNYSIASQDGTLSGIAANLQLMHASMADMTAGSKKVLSLTMENLMAIGRFNITEYSTFSSSSAVTLTSGASATLDLTTSALSSPENGSITLSNPTQDYYVVIIPGSTQMTFCQSGNIVTSTFESSSAFAANKIYTDLDGAAVALTPDYYEGSFNYTHGLLCGGIIWAPVNCGVGGMRSGETKNQYAYGKLYQWGRKEGQGYQDATYSPGESDPSIAQSPWSGLNGEEDAYTFYKGNSSSNSNWLSSTVTTYWNAGTESNPNKNIEFDPCPDGWRVPTKTELSTLTSLSRTWTTVSGQNGALLKTGPHSLFIPFLGYRKHDTGAASLRGTNGHLWCSASETGTTGSLNGYLLTYNNNGNNNYMAIDHQPRANGFAVRCVYDPNTLSGNFSVSDTKKVKFSRGNLYYDGSTFKFEDNQYAYTTSYDANHVCRFRWAENSGTISSDITSSVGTGKSLSGTTSDVFFTNATQTTPRTDFTVQGQTGVWRTLSKDEWDYLLSKRKVNGATGEGKTCQRAAINSDGSSVFGLIIYPDNYTSQNSATSYTTSNWAAMESAGCVFLPGAGIRDGETLGNSNYGRYWSSTPFTSEDRAYFQRFNIDQYLDWTDGQRYYGSSVRLVRDAN